MANILFKRGLHSALPTTAVDGAFYLTTDSHRLYAGIGTELVDLNQYIQVVSNIEGNTDSLQALTNVQSGDFAYVKNGNILAIYQDKAWVQINKNTDTVVTGLDATGDGAAADGTLTLSITSSEGTPVTTDIKFLGKGGTDVTVAEDGTITVQGAVYSIAGKGTAQTGATGGEVSDYKITLSADDADITDSTVTLKPGANITFKEVSGALEISAPDTPSLQSTEINANNAGDLTVVVTDTMGTSVTDTAEKVLYYKYGKNADQTVYNQGTINAYTIAEVDKLFNDLNGMTYKSVVSSFANLPTSGVKVGDLYMASAAFNFKLAADGYTASSGTGKTCKIGDLFIAQGTETNGVITSDLTWHYVPAGDDSQTDTTYSASVDVSEHKIVIKNNNTGDTMATVDFNNTDGKLKVTSSTNTDGNLWTLQVDHATVNPNKTTSQSLGEDKVIAIDTITVDATGHVTAINTKTTTIRGYALSGASVTATGNVATVTDTLTDTNGTAAGTSVFTVDASADDNLNVTANAGGTGFVLKLEWGTF